MVESVKYPGRAAAVLAMRNASLYIQIPMRGLPIAYLSLHQGTGEHVISLRVPSVEMACWRIIAWN